MSDDDENLPDPSTVLSIVYYLHEVVIVRGSDCRVLWRGDWKENAGEVGQIWLTEDLK